MDQFLKRDELNVDERAVLDIYMTGLVHALTSVNAVRGANNQDFIFSLPEGHPVLEAAALEGIVAEFLIQRPDMQRLALGLVAVTAVMHKYPA